MNYMVDEKDRVRKGCVSQIEYGGMCDLEIQEFIQVIELTFR